MLAYAKANASPPQGDAYTSPYFEQYRDGVKKDFNALLFDKGPRRAFPKGVNILFPPKTKIGDDAVGGRRGEKEGEEGEGGGHVRDRECEEPRGWRVDKERRGATG